MGRASIAPLSKEVTFRSSETQKTTKLALSNYKTFQLLRADAANSLGYSKQRVYFTHKNKILQDYDQLRQVVVNDVIIDVNLVQAKVPGPPILPLVGSLIDLLPDFDGNWHRLLLKHGPLMKFGLLGDTIHMTNDPDVMEWIMLDGEYFTKNLAGPLLQLRPLGRKGLFTADTKDPQWQLGHKLLMPAFSPKAMRSYINVIAQVASKLCNVLNEFIEQGKKVDPIRWMTNVTFESIAKVGFGYSFGVVENSKGPFSHPFLDAMASTLNEVRNRVSRPELMSYLPLPSNKKFNRDIETMHNIVSQVIASKRNRKQATDTENDLLDYMLHAKDEHGNSMSEDLIIDQVITFLIAGHETTANTLCWALYLLASHPNILEQCREEIQQVQFGDDNEPITAAHVSKLVLIERVIKETLRLYPPVTMTVKVCQKECVLPTGHELQPGDLIAPHFFGLHRNPNVWPDPEKFDPDRWLPENENKRSTYSWLPFSIGARACIGRQFAILEAKIVLATLLRNYHYTIPKIDSVKRDLSSITVKPTSFSLQLSHRRSDKLNGGPTLSRMNTLSSTPSHSKLFSETPSSSSPSIKFGKLDPSAKTNAPHSTVPVTILYGSNTGTAMDYAHSLGTTMDDLGFKPTVCSLDEWHAITRSSHVPPNNAPYEMVFIVTATYNGLPPENARKFDQYLSRVQTGVISSSLTDLATSAEKNTNGGTNTAPFKKIKYAVFGCGNSDWAATYQSFPTKIDDAFESLGATRFVQKGASDAKLSSNQEMFDKWMAFVWEQLAITYKITVSTVPFTANEVEAEAASISMLNLNDETSELNTREILNCAIVESVELQDIALSGRSTRRIKIEIPDDAEFLPGDHFEILPQQTDERVEKVATLLKWNLNDVFKIGKTPSKSSTRAMISVIKGHCSIRSALTYYADLTGPVTQAFLRIAGDAVSNVNAAGAQLGQELLQLSNPGAPSYSAFVAKHPTLIDFLEAHPLVCSNISLTDFLCGVNVMTPRRYSIANSPRTRSSPKETKYVELVVGLDVFRASNGKEYQGLASSFLCSATPVTPLHGSIKRCPDSFRLPSDPSTPVVMIAAGTGISPFFGFLEDRDVSKCVSSSHGGVSETMLIFGCRGPYDQLAAEKLTNYVSKGVLMHYETAFSRVPQQPKEYVQDIVKKNASLLWNWIHEKNAVVYICGSSAMSKGVSSAFEAIFTENGISSSSKYLGDLRASARYNEDVWG